MNHHQTLARPYAKALFSLAMSEKKLTEWSQVLSLLAEVAEQPTIQSLYNNPHVSKKQLVDLFYSIVEDAGLGNPEVKNLIKLLAYYKRLSVLANIALLFEEDRASLEKTLQIEVTSAFTVKTAIRHALQKALEIRLQRDVKMHFHIDKSILGGAVIRAGDLVIDGSVRSKLQKLKQAVMS